MEGALTATMMMMLHIGRMTDAVYAAEEMPAESDQVFAAYVEARQWMNQTIFARGFYGGAWPEYVQRSMKGQEGTKTSSSESSWRISLGRCGHARRCAKDCPVFRKGEG